MSTTMPELVVEPDGVADREGSSGLENDGGHEVLDESLEGERQDQTTQSEGSEEGPDPHAKDRERVEEPDQEDDVGDQPARDDGGEAAAQAVSDQPTQDPVGENGDDESGQECAAGSYPVTARERIDDDLVRGDQGEKGGSRSGHGLVSILASMSPPATSPIRQPLD